MTSFRRYDHFASLCELMPVSMASLAISIKLILNYAVTGKTTNSKKLLNIDTELILQALKCPSETTINQLISGDDSCHFPGYKVRDAIRDLVFAKEHYENASWVHNREAAYLQRSQIKLNTSNPFYVDAIGNSYRRSLARLDKVIEQLK
ncbi:unnamed protein product [Nippostrongylus brasiliensis]|uniref:DUF4065 domain-containing protein n=1 Tax=Nippostrongylus brasiliensis TaxID=27835 RepID=A0A0N4Y2E7_NIPBR|nr:unnamed protein product [Nippostrongylus brasiliensis]